MTHGIQSAGSGRAIGRPRLGLAEALVIALGLALAASAPAAAISEEAPSMEVLTFDRFIQATSPVCSFESSEICFALAFDYTDVDGDGLLTVDELRLVRDALEDWSLWRDEALTPKERNGIRLGLWLVDAVGLERLHASYDTDGDQALGSDELLTDVDLDDRPMADVLLDPEAVDRAAVARRLGALSPFLDQALPE